MKQAVLTVITTVSLFATLAIPIGCSSSKVITDDDSLREPSAARALSARRSKVADWTKRKRRQANLRKKTPRQVLQHFYTKHAVEDNSATTKPEITSPYVEASDDSAVQSCLTAACGTGASNSAASNVISRPGFKIGDITPAVEQLWNTEFDSKVDAFYQREVSSTTVKTSRLEKLIQRGATIRQDHPLLPFLSFFNVFSLLGENTGSYLKTDESGRYVFNEEAAKKAVQLSPDQLNIMRLVFNKYLIPAMLASSEANPLDNPLVSRLKINYASLDLIEAQKADAKTLMTELDQISKIVGPLVTQTLFDEGQKADVVKAASGVELSSSESSAYVDLAEAIDMLNLVYFDPETVAALKRLPFDVKSEMSKFISGGGLAVAKQVAQAVSDGAAGASSETKLKCKMLLSASTELNASALRYRKILEAVRSVKTAAKSVVVGLVDSKGLDYAQARIEAVQFSKPASNEERIQTLRDGAISEERSLRTDEIITKDQSEDSDEMILIMALLNYKKPVADTVKDDLSTELSKACDKLPVETASDFTLTSQGRIALSWYSANYPEYGVSILGHEMGHMVSTILRTEQVIGIQNAKFSEFRDCVANRNPYLVEPKSVADMEQSTWVEEDWADRFSSLVMEELTRTGDSWAMKQNLGCALVSIDSGSYSGNKLAPGPDDNHSSGFLRTLMVGTDRGGLPNECKSFLLYAVKAKRELHCN